MFYIEKNDKPNRLVRILNLIKVEANTITVPICEKTTSKQIEKLAQKTNKIINKLSNSKKVVLSKQAQEEVQFVNYLNSYGIQIANGRWLFEILLTNIVEYLIHKKKIEKANISILINDLTEIELRNIKTLAIKYKTINIVTNHIEKFTKLEEKLQEEGVIITITNNKKKSLMKSNIIINVDFPKELLNKYRIKEDSDIINLRGKMKIIQKRFNGLNINNYEIDFRDDKKEICAYSGKFYLRDLYESKLYKKQGIDAILQEINRDKIVIKKLYLNNGTI